MYSAGFFMSALIFFLLTNDIAHQKQQHHHTNDQRRGHFVYLLQRFGIVLSIHGKIDEHANTKVQRIPVGLFHGAKIRSIP